MKFKPFTVIALLVVLAALTACGKGGTPPPAATPSPSGALRSTHTATVSPTADPKSETYLRDFETVWRTVDQRHFDPTFGGVDWQALHDHYQPLIAAAPDDTAFYDLINQMLFELGVSHLALIPPGGWAEVEPVLSAQGTIGIDVRLLDGEAVITAVEAASVGHKAGLRPGYVVQTIDGVPVQDIIATTEARLAPPHNARGRVENITRAILARIYGPAETLVTIAYRDEGGETHEASVLRAPRERKATMLGLPVYLEFEALRLEGEVGYVRFNTFNPALTDEILGTIQSMRDAPGLIIDVRGNPGGMPQVAVALAEELANQRALFYGMKTRDQDIAVTLDPVEAPYAGPVAVLVDVASTSASELFAAGMQGIGRAAVVGDHTSGSVLAAEIKFLPSDASFLYPVVQIVAPDGATLEGRGVVPDIEVALDRALLSQGVDAQLDAAIRYIGDELMREAAQQERLRGFGEALERLRVKWDIPGMSVAVLRRGAVVYAQGFGYADIENGVPATENTLYHIASLTKPFAAALIMQLVEAGRLDLDAAMAQLLKDARLWFPGSTLDGYDAACATLKALSQDTPSQYADFRYLFQNYNCDTQLITVRHHLTHTSQGQPGQVYLYNGFLFGFLTQVIEGASGKPYEQLLVERIIEPLGMTSTFPNPDEVRGQEILAQRAKPYRVNEDGAFEISAYPEGLNAAAGMVSTVLDLAKFDAAMDSDTIVSAASRAAMFSPTVNSAGTPLPYGMGWFVQQAEGVKLVWHYGYQLDAYSSLIVKAPSKELTFILLANSGGASADFNLHFGDLLASPFAAAFLEQLVE